MYVLLLVSGSTIHKMKVDRQYMGVSKRQCIVWGVAFLSDGTVISADSAGKVQFWDSATGTLVKSHLIANADVQSIAVADVSTALFGAVGTTNTFSSKWGARRNFRKAYLMFLSILFQGSCVPYQNIFFFFFVRLKDSPLCVCVHMHEHTHTYSQHMLLFQSSVDGHLSYFHLLSIVDSADRNTDV